jgi:hypothetical protein
VNKQVWSRKDYWRQAVVDGRGRLRHRKGGVAFQAVPVLAALTESTLAADLCSDHDYFILAEL